MKVLVVDDEADIRRIALLALTRIGGLEVVEARGGAEALAAARAAAPDVVLLDVMMPGMDGPETLRALRADAATAAIPVVFLTAKALETEQRRLLALGAAGVLVKPFDPLKLAAELRAVLERR